LHETVEAQWQQLAERSDLDPRTVAYCKEVQDVYVCRLIETISSGLQAVIR
jgi:hypothetical protein